MSADLEMVKTYIKYLKSFCPTPEEREFLEKHKKDILEMLNRKLYPSDDCKLYYPI